MSEATKSRLAAILDAAWKTFLDLHRNEVGAAGDQPEKDGATAAAATAAADDDAGPLTNDSLYPEGGEGGETGTDKRGKPAKTKPKDGEGEGEGEEGKGNDRTAEWDRERQARDQAHANERRTMLEQLRTTQETNQKLLERLEAAAKPAKGTEADEDLKELDAALSAQASVTEDSDPADFVRAQREVNQRIAKALRKVRTSSGASPELEQLRQQVADTQAELEELRAGSESKADADAFKERKTRFEEHVAALDKKHGPQLRNPAKALAVKRLLAAGYTKDNPPSEDVELLAMELAYRDAKDDLDAKKPKGGGRSVPAADSGAGGGAAGAGKPKGRMTNKQYLRQFRGR